MNCTIEKCTPKEYSQVYHLIQQAFEKEAMSDHKEQFLVERLINSKDHIPELSLIAKKDNEILGYILLSKIKVNSSNNSFEALALAPVAVLPKYQALGVGKALIEAAHQKAKEMGFSCIILLGHENYYPRFGYQLCHLHNISLPFDVPKENCMVIELQPNTLKDISGVVEYPIEFML